MRNCCRNCCPGGAMSAISNLQYQAEDMYAGGARTRDPEAGRHVQTFRARDETQLKKDAHKWKDRVQTRAVKAFEEKDLIKCLKVLAAGIDRDDTPFGQANSGHLYWYGNISDKGDPVCQIVKPGQKEKSDCLVRWLLCYLFLPDAIYQLLPKGIPITMKCSDPENCIHIQHTQIAMRSAAMNAGAKAKGKAKGKGKAALPANAKMVPKKGKGKGKAS